MLVHQFEEGGPLLVHELAADDFLLEADIDLAGVLAVAVTPDGLRAVSGLHDDVLKERFWQVRRLSADCGRAGRCKHKTNAGAL